MSDHLALAQERHDNPPCEVCGTPTWRGDLVDDVCAICLASAFPRGDR